MADLLIVTRRDRVIIYPETPRAQNWIKRNMVYGNGYIVYIQKDALEDVLKLFNESCLTYEEK